MLVKRNARIIVAVLSVVLLCNLWIALAISPAWAASSGTESHSKIIQGCNYELTKSRLIYKGPGKKYGAVLRSELRPSTRKHTVKKFKEAKLKKGTMVSCLRIKDSWMKIPSGWIKIEKNCMKPIKKTSH